MGKLTSDLLLKALKESKTYNETKPYVEALAAGEQYIIEIINNAFLSILTSDKASLMSKLLVLRMYKDLFKTGNIEMFDKIDPEVEEVIISAAAYNPKCKPKGKADTRGAMYFVDTQKRQKNQQTTKLGHSFVILATQIIKFFASWLPEGPDQSPTRFVEIAQQLATLGVQFNTNSYFTADQQKIFKKNYAQWKKKAIQKNKESSHKQISSGKKISHQQHINEQKNPQKQGKIKNQNTDKVEKQQKTSNIQISTQEIQRLKKQYEQSIKKLEQQKQKAIQLVKSENEKKISIMNDQLVRREMEITQFKQLNQKIREQNKKLLDDLSIKQKNKSGQQIQTKQIVQKFRNEKQELQKLLTSQKQQKRVALTKIATLQSEMNKLNEKLMILNQGQNNKLKQIDNNQKRQVQAHKKVIQRLQNQRSNEKKQKETLKQKLNQKNQQLNQLKKIIQKLKKQSQLKQQDKIKSVQRNSKRQKLRKDIILQKEPQGLFILGTQQKQVTDENKKACEFIMEKLQSKKKIDVVVSPIIEQTKKYENCSKGNLKQLDLNCMSLSKFLNTQLLCEKKNEDIFCKTDFPVKKSSNSLHKTQNSKIRWENHVSKQKNKNNYSSKLNFGFKRTQNCLNKTENLRKYRQTLTSVFPFLKDYFAPIQANKQYAHFRACCFLQQARKNPFFQDQFIQLRISKNKRKSSRIHLSLVNKMPYQIEAIMLSESAQIHLSQAQSTLKLSAFGEGRVPITFSVTNLNFRFAILNLLLKSVGRNQKTYNIPLPITLIDGVELSPDLESLQSFEKFNENQYKKYRSQRITPNSLMKNIPLCFPDLYFQKNGTGKYQSSSIAKYPKIPEINVKLNIIYCGQFVQFETEFVSTSKFSQAFSKVIIQVLMFIFI